MNKVSDPVSIYVQAFFNLCMNKKVKWQNYLETNLSLIKLLTLKQNYFWNWLQRLDLIQLKKELKIILPSQLEAYWWNLINILLEDCNFHLFLSILFSLKKKMYQVLNIKLVNVYSVVPLNQKQLQKLERKLIKRLQSSVELTTKIDKELLGGVCVEVGNLRLDNSLQKRLWDLEQEFTK